MRTTIRPSLFVALAACAGCLTLQAAPSGQWDFNSGNLSATIGGDMTYGASGQAGTAFGSTTSFGIPDINGEVAQVLSFTGYEIGSGLRMPTPTAANGGGSLVNQWTLIMDVLFPAASDSKWRSIIDIDESVINADAEFFVNTSNGIGISGQYDGQVVADTWHRIAVTMDSVTGTMRKYIDGAEVGVQNLGNVLEGRWAMAPNYYAELFTDNDGDIAPGYVNSIQLWAQVLTAGDMIALGGPSAAGIPTSIPTVSSFIESRDPAVNGVNASPLPAVTVVLNQGGSTVAQGSIQMQFDDAGVTPGITVDGKSYTITYTPTAALAPLSEHSIQLNWTDSADGARTESWTFTVADYINVNLPDPIAFEDFDAVAEGSLPAGWAVTNLTDIAGTGLDLSNANSDSYADFVVISTDTLSALNVNSDRRFAMNPIVENGVVLESLVSGNFAYGESDVRSGNQVQVMFSKDFNCSGQSNVYLSYHSMYEQNQDNIASVEYSIDGGATWLPVVYMIDAPDIIMNGEEVDAVATLSEVRGDQAHGEAYGTWIGAAVTQDLAPYISGRINDDRLESKRVELFRLPQADNQAAVRLRFMQAGTASWYFGVDNVGLYSINTALPPVIGDQPAGSWVHAGSSFNLSVTATGTEPFTYTWYKDGAAIAGATEATYSVASASVSDAGTYAVEVSNAQLTGGAAVMSKSTQVDVFAGSIGQDLVVHLKFDNNLNDASGAGNNGQAVGSPTFVTGAVGGAVNIPSGSDYVSLGAPSDLDFGSDVDFSISFWALNPEGGWSGDPSFIGNKDWNSGGNQGYVIAGDGDGRVQWNYAGPPAGRKDYDGPGGTFGNANWHHVVVAYDRSGMASTYVDGVLANRTLIGDGVRDVTTPGANSTNIGQDGTGSYGSTFSDLSVDDLGIWRRVVTPTEVAAIYAAGLAGNDLSTVVIDVVTQPEVGGVTYDAGAGSVTVTWSDSTAVLQQASDLSGATWQDVSAAGATSHTTSTPGFFRLRK
ncbi:MAG: LamG-like jellyroll fold domain-containing protein [Limisphaerales bacterium]